MLNEEKQIRYSKWFIYIIVICAFGVGAWHLFGVGGVAGNYNDVQGTVQGISDHNRQTGQFIDGAAEHVSSAVSELDRVDEANRRAAFILSEDQKRINACAGIIIELQKNNSRAEQILADVERANKTPAGSQ